MTVPPSTDLPRTEPVSLAPMVKKSDRNWRWVMRRITRKTLLYTEMIAAPAVLFGDRKRILGFDPSEAPLVLQLGWDVPEDLAEACRIAEDYGYDEINLNCGCPSEKVRRHDFGACLMARPDHTARIVEAMSAATRLPISVKHRIGILSRASNLSWERYEDLHHFVTTVADAGCRKFIVHARIADLDGLNPKKNREVPPLRPGDVYRLKKELPHLRIEINGGFRTPEAVDDALTRVDGVMLGRIALDRPWMLAGADRRWFGVEESPPTRLEVLEAAIPYLQRRAALGDSLSSLLRPLFPLFAGRRGGKIWRRKISQISRDALGTGLRDAIAAMDTTSTPETVFPSSTVDAVR